MSSGRVQVASTGIQDVFLTGNPEVTYFQKRFSRHTRFALEVLNNVFDEPAVFGGTSRCIVERKGDLIRTIFLKVELSTLNTSTTSNVGYTNAIGHALIDYADLIIGGKLIERITGEYIDIYSEMFISQSQQTAMNFLVGKTSSRTGLGPASGGTYPRTFFVPLPFYFNRSDPVAVPLSAIYRQEVEVHVKFRKLENLIVTPDSSILGGPTTGTILNASLPVEYVFLEPNETASIKNSRLDYIVTQLQLSSAIVPANVTEQKFRLDFINPVKEMFFVIQNQSNVAANAITGNDWFNYKNEDNINNIQYHQLTSLNLDFNNETIIDSTVADALFMYAIQPMYRHTRVPDTYIYNYSFSLDPENYIPTGQVNMSRIQNKVLTLNLSNCTQDRNVRIYAKSYNILRVENGLSGLLFIDNNNI
jgi:hypothetical protein